MSGFDKYFSVLALFILFRETIEASIICSVLLQFLNRSKPALKKTVWQGVAAGVGVSIIFGVIFIAIFYTAKNSLFSGKNRDWFKGIISYIAGFLITILGFAMLRFLGWEAKWKRKLAAAIKEKVPEVIAPAEDAVTGDLPRLDDADGNTASAVAAKDDGDSARLSAGGVTPEAPVAAAKEVADAPTAAAPSTTVAAGRATSSESDVSSGTPTPQPEQQPSSPQPQPSVLQQQSSLPPPQSEPSSVQRHASLPPATPQSQPSGMQPQPSLLTSPTLTTSSSSSAAALKKATFDNDCEAAKKKEAAADADVESGSAAAAGDIKISSDSDTDAPPAEPAVAMEVVDRSPATRREITNIFLLVFTTVVREGIESIVFLGGLGNVKLTAIPLPSIVGIVCGVLVGVFLYYSGKQVKHIKWLVIIMAIIIFFIAAGQINIGTDALMRAGAFGYCSPWLDERPWYMKPIYDWSACCSDTDPTGREPTDVQNRKRFFALTRAIFGYQDKGTPVEIIAYCCYWALVLIIMAWKAWRGTLLDADYKYTRAQKKAAKEARKREEEEEEARAREAAALEGGEAAVAQVEEVVVESKRRSGWKMCGLGRLGSWKLCCVKGSR